MRFAQAEDYYATALHELLPRDQTPRRAATGNATSTRDSKVSYAFEELVAEMGAAFLMAALGISGTYATTPTTSDLVVDAVAPGQAGDFQPPRRRMKAATLGTGRARAAAYCSPPNIAPEILKRRPAESVERIREQRKMTETTRYHRFD